MGIIKDIKELKKDVAEIKANVSKDSLLKLKELDELKSYLPFIHLKVKNIVDISDFEGKKRLKIFYEAPSVVLDFDDNGNVMLNEVFRSINALNLIDMDDQMLILKKINEKKI